MTQPDHAATIAAAKLMDLQAQPATVNDVRGALAAIEDLIRRVEAIEVETKHAVAYCEFMSIFEDTQIPINEKHAALISGISDGIREAIRQVNENFASMAEAISALRAENAEIKERLAAMESWRETQTGDGR